MMLRTIASAILAVGLLAGCGDDNKAPVAQLQSPARAVVGSTVDLDASESSDADGDALTFEWALEVPSGSSISLESASGSTNRFVPDLAGKYTVSLTVRDGKASAKTSSTVEVTEAPVLNEAPVAKAGEDRSVSVGSTVTLDGSGSTDPEGSALEYAWSFVSVPDGSSASFDVADATAPSFTADKVGTYVVSLRVSDGDLDSEAVQVEIQATNAAPTVEAGTPVVGNIGAPIAIEAVANDPDGHALTVRWSVVSGPEGAASELEPVDALETAFVTDLPGDYTVEVEVSDPYGGVASDSVSISVANRAPTAQVGSAPTGHVGDTLQLTGSGTDPDGQPLTYLWTVVSAPTGSTVTLSNATAANTSFVPDFVGTYRFSLVVNDGFESSLPAELEVVVANQLPVAFAGSDLTGNVGDIVTLSGSAQDADGQTLTSTWAFVTRPTGSSASLTGANTLNASFVPDVVGSYTLELSVSDGIDTAIDTVTVTVANRLPIVTASNVSGTVGKSIALQATASDADGHTLQFTWAVVSAPTGGAATITSGTGANASITPDAVGTWQLKVTVSDGIDSVDAAFELEAVNQAPVVSAGNDLSGIVGEVVALTAIASDADGHTLQYTWSVLSAPNGATVTITDEAALQASFVPASEGTYTFRFTATDGYASTSDEVSVNVAAAGVNRAPMAEAGADQVVNLTAGLTIELSGVASSDPDGDTLTYAWTIVSRPVGSVVNLATAGSSATLVPDMAGTWEISLEVSDGELTDTDSVSVRVNTPPVANAGPDATVNVNDTVTLTAAGSTDADGDMLTVTWAQLSGPEPLTLSNPNAMTQTVIPTLAGDYVFEVTVEDGVASSTDSVTITVNGAPSAPCLVFSEYVEGSSNNKAIELYNCGTSDLDLAEYRICLGANGTTTCTQINLSGILAGGAVHVVCHPQMTPAATCNSTNNNVTFNGDDALRLQKVNGGVLVDALGRWGAPRPAQSTWENMTLRRECSLTPYLETDDFTLPAVWGQYYKKYPIDSVSDLGIPPVVGSCP